MLKSLFVGAALIVTASGAVAAAPLALAPIDHPEIILVSGGCGPAFHRGPFGGCVANRRVIVRGPVVVETVRPVVVAPVRLPPPCPRGYYRDPDPARPLCYPRF